MIGNREILASIRGGGSILVLPIYKSKRRMRKEREKGRMGEREKGRKGEREKGNEGTRERRQKSGECEQLKRSWRWLWRCFTIWNHERPNCSGNSGVYHW
jgi:hypothetical protein